jgi:hypothetical protein
MHSTINGHTSVDIGTESIDTNKKEGGILRKNSPDPAERGSITLVKHER